MNTNRDKLNMDSPYFDAELALTDILSNSNVSQLVNKCNELQIDIRSYDQDIQAMVFENYSKFITSIDTVKKMKDDIEKVDVKLKTLEESIKKINNAALKIDDSLKIKRNEIQKLDTINKDLQRLRILCELPKVSKYDLLEYKKIVAPKTPISTVNFDTVFSQTIEYFSICGRELIKFQNEPLIKPIYNDSIGNIEQIYSILWDLQTNSSLSEENLRKVTKKLVVVAKEEGHALGRYLNIVKDRIKRKIKELFDDPNYSSENFYRIEKEETEKYLKSYDYDIVLKEFEVFKHKIERDIYNDPAKISGSYIKLMEKFSETVIGDIKTEIKFLINEFTEVLKKIGSQPATFEKIDGFIKDIIALVLSRVTDKLTQKKVSNYEVNECLKSINKDLLELLGLKDDKNLRREIMDKFSSNIEAIVRGQVMNSFTGMRNNFLVLLNELKEKASKIPEVNDENDVESLKKEIFALQNTFKNRFYVNISNTLIELKTLLSNTDILLNSQLMFMSLLHGQYVEYLKNLIKLILTKSSRISGEFLKNTNVLILQKSDDAPQNKEYVALLTELNQVPESSAYNMLLIQIVNILQKKYLHKAFEALFELFQQTYSMIDSETKAHYQSLRHSLENEEMIALNNTLQKEQWKCYMNYNEYYYELINKHLSNHINRQNWIGGQEPRDVSKDMENVSILLKKMFFEMGFLFPDTKRSLLKKKSFLETRSFNTDMDKMLARKTHMFEKMDINRNSMILTVVKCLLKTFLDKIRRKRYDKYGYQQMQADCYYIVQLAFDMVSFEDESMILGYYYEIMDSLREICFEPVPLDRTIVETISSVKRQRLQC